MYFECKSDFVGGDGYCVGHGSRLRVPSSKARMREYWSNMVSLYTLRVLGKWEDRLSAIGGLANKISLNLDDKYIAGFWKKSILRDLVWPKMGKNKQSFPPSPYRAPTWSWAAIEAEITFNDYPSSRLMVKLLSYQIQPSANPFGPPSSGYLRVKAPRIRLHFAKKTRNACTMKNNKGKHFKLNALIDYGMSSTKLKGMKLYGMFVVKVTERMSGTDPPAYSCIIITPVKNETGRYRRIGQILLEGSELGSEDQTRTRRDLP
jgi:hypothetical protein